MWSCAPKMISLLHMTTVTYAIACSKCQATVCTLKKLVVGSQTDGKHLYSVKGYQQQQQQQQKMGNLLWPITSTLGISVPLMTCLCL